MEESGNFSIKSSEHRLVPGRCTSRCSHTSSSSAHDSSVQHCWGWIPVWRLAPFCLYHFTTVPRQTQQQQHKFPKASRHYILSTHLQSEGNHSADKTPPGLAEELHELHKPWVGPTTWSRQHRHHPTAAERCAGRATARGAAELAALQPALCLRGKHRSAATHPLGTWKITHGAAGAPKSPS